MTDKAPNIPHRHLELDLSIGADDLDTLVDTLHEIADELSRDGRLERDWASGGWGRGFSLRLRRDPEMSGDRYRQLVSEYVNGSGQQNGSSAADR